MAGYLLQLLTVYHGKQVPKRMQVESEKRNPCYVVYNYINTAWVAKKETVNFISPEGF